MWLSHILSTISESDFHRGIRRLMDGPFSWRTLLSKDRGGSPRFLNASISSRAMLSDPAGVSDNHRLYRLPTIAFHVFDHVGPRMSHEAQSLHLRYGPIVALSTLSSCCCQSQTQDSIPGGVALLLSGTGISPAESTRLILAHQNSL
jgi:hypothetical protein